MLFTFQVALPVDARFLPKTRQAIAGYLEEFLPSEEALDDVVLALGEACANVISHAFPNGANGEGGYVVRAEMDGDEVRMFVEDEGVGLDPARLDRDWVAPEATSGRGLTIIRELMHSVDVEPTSGGNGTRLVMRKKLSE